VLQYFFVRTSAPLLESASWSFEVFDDPPNMRIKERFEEFLQVVRGIGYTFFLKRFLQLLLKTKAVASEILNVIAGILAQIHQLPMFPAISLRVGFVEDIVMVVPEGLLPYIQGKNLYIFTQV
jgi:hypothetical protein